MFEGLPKSCSSQKTDETLFLPLRYIGVVGVDATLDEIENFLTKHQWGSVYSFLINSKAGVVFHPRLKPSAKV